MAAAQHLIDQDGIEPAEAMRQVLMLVKAAHEQYRGLGALLGDTDAGFLLWMRPRHRPPTA